MKNYIFLVSVILCTKAAIAQSSFFSSERMDNRVLFSTGYNALSNAPIDIYENIDMNKSRFFEIGYLFNTKLFEGTNRYHLNYGLAVAFNNIRIKNGYYYENSDSDAIPAFNSDIDLSKFRNTFFQIPIHMEFDFTSKKRLNSDKFFERGIKTGIGGFIGFRMNTKQRLEYNTNQEDVFQDDFSMNNFSYGVSSYVGFSFISLYVKYDVQNMFKYSKSSIHPNPHNFSFGLRFDF